MTATAMTAPATVSVPVAIHSVSCLMVSIGTAQLTLSTVILPLGSSVISRVCEESARCPLS